LSPLHGVLSVLDGLGRPRKDLSLGNCLFRNAGRCSRPVVQWSLSLRREIGSTLPRVRKISLPIVLLFMRFAHAQVAVSSFALLCHPCLAAVHCQIASKFGLKISAKVVADAALPCLLIFRLISSSFHQPICLRDHDLIVRHHSAPIEAPSSPPKLCGTVQWVSDRPTFATRVVDVLHEAAAVPPVGSKDVRDEMLGLVVLGSNWFVEAVSALLRLTIKL
jgi:hypothetical protein